MFVAAEAENIEIIKLLCTLSNIDVNICNKYSRGYWSMKKTALFVSVENENIEIIKLLLANDKIDVNIINETYFANGGGYKKYWNYCVI